MFDFGFGIKEDWVVFYDIFSKNGNGDSIRPVAEEWKKRYPNHRFFFCAKKKNQPRSIDMADEVLVKDSLKFKYVTSRAKYIFTNMSFPNKGKKRKGQVFVSLWHGTPIKKLYLSKDKNNKKYKKYTSQFLKSDFFCTQSDKNTQYMKEAFGLSDIHFINSGLPRNDILFSSKTQEIRARIRSELGITEDKKILFYCPTWRRYDYKMPMPFDIARLKEEFSSEYCILLRSHVGKHDWVDKNGNKIDLTNDKFAIDVASYPEISELYIVADALICDYSSAIFDFAITAKPQIFYAYDFEDYMKEFGIYQNYKDFVPGEIPTDTEELIQSIKNLDKFNECFGEKYERFRQEFCQYDKGNSAKILVDSVISSV